MACLSTLPPRLVVINLQFTKWGVKIFKLNSPFFTRCWWPTLCRHSPAASFSHIRLPHFVITEVLVRAAVNHLHAITHSVLSNWPSAVLGAVGASVWCHATLNHRSGGSIQKPKAPVQELGLEITYGTWISLFCVWVATNCISLHKPVL